MSTVLMEDATIRLKRQPVKITLTLRMREEVHVPDMLTMIRALPAVTVVGQGNRVARSHVKGTVLDVYVKYIPKPGTIYRNIREMALLVKSIPGVKIVRVNTYGNRPVTHGGKLIVV